MDAEDVKPEPQPQSCMTTSILHISLHQPHLSFYFSLLYLSCVFGISPPGFLLSIPVSSPLEFTFQASFPKLIFKQ